MSLELKGSHPGGPRRAFRSSSPRASPCAVEETGGLEAGGSQTNGRQAGFFASCIGAWKRRNPH